MNTDAPPAAGTRLHVEPCDALRPVVIKVTEHPAWKIGRNGWGVRVMTTNNRMVVGIRFGTLYRTGVVLPGFKPRRAKVHTFAECPRVATVGQVAETLQGLAGRNGGG